MKKQFSIICALMLISTTLTGCVGSMPSQPGDDSDFHVEDTPLVNTDENETESAPTVSDGSLGEEEVRELEWWEESAISRIPKNLEPDLTQTGELYIFYDVLPSIFIHTPALEMYRTVYPNVELTVEHAGDWAAFRTIVSTELMAGGGSDILFPSSMNHSDIHKLADTGVFMDLNDFIKADDSFNLESYIIPVMDGGIINGKRYSMPYYYMINGFTYLPSTLDKIGFDTTRMSDPVSFMEEIVRTLPKAQEKNGFRYMYNGNLLYALFRTSGIRIVDVETKEILPDEEYFERFIKAYKPYFRFDYDTYDISPDVAGYLNSGLMMFNYFWDSDFLWHAGSLKRYGEYQIQTMPNIKNENPVFQHKYGGIGTLAIRAGCPNQQNAWNYIKLMLSEAYQGRDNFVGIPVHRDSVFTQFAYWYDWHRQEDNLYFHIPELSKKEIDAFLTMVIDVDKSTYYDFFYWDFILGHLESYFNDEINYEETVARIKNDLRLYLSE